MTAHRDPTAAPATGTPPPAVAAGVGVATHQPGVTGRVAPAERGMAWAEAPIPAGAALPAGPDSERSEATSHNLAVSTPRSELSTPPDAIEALVDMLRPRTPVADPSSQPTNDPTSTFTRDDPSSPVEPGGRGLLAITIKGLEALKDKARRALTRAQRTMLTCTLSIGPSRTVVNLGIVNLDHPHECPLCGAPVVPCHRTEV